MLYSPISMGKNRNSIIGKAAYLEAAQVFHWATKEHFIIWFTGERERHKRTETILPRLVRNGKLTALRYGHSLIYSVPRMNRELKNGDRLYDDYDEDMEKKLKVKHGLGCTEGLVRIWRSNMAGVIIAERHFRGFNIVPEWGILYNNHKLLLFEFCTRDNSVRTNVVKGKLTRYRNNLPYIEEKFYGAKAIVMFVLAVRRPIVKRIVGEVRPAGDPFFFTDYKSFLEVPHSKQLTTPIYIWGEDGESYPLVTRK